MVNTSTDAVVSTIPVAAGSGPDALAVQPGARAGGPGSGALLYVANANSNSVFEVDTGLRTTVATIPIGHTSDAVAINPLGTLVYVADTSGGANGRNPIGVTVINASTNRVVTTIPFGGNVGIPPASRSAPTGRPHG